MAGGSWRPKRTPAHSATNRIHHCQPQRCTRRQRIISGAVSLALIVSIALTVIALTQRHQALRAAQVALARQLAAQAQVGTVRTPYNLLLALESISITQKIGAFSPTASRQLLNDVLNVTGGIPLQHAAPVVAVGFSPDDHWLAVASANSLQLWDMQMPSPAPIPLRGHDKVINALAFSPDGLTLATVGDDPGVRLWEMATANRAASAHVLALIAPILWTSPSAVMGVGWRPLARMAALNCGTWLRRTQRRPVRFCPMNRA